jgi:hypothetical protein
MVQPSLLALGHRNVGPQEHSTGGSVSDHEVTADAVYALLDSEKAQTLHRNITLGQPAAIVLHGNLEHFPGGSTRCLRALLAGYANPDCLGIRMTDHVGQRLLQQSINDDCHDLVQSLQTLADPDVDGDTGSFEASAIDAALQRN